jgi:DNA-binding transcriptional regulator YhcF (GntR family)
VTRQGKGSFVAEQADLSARLRLAELDSHLSSASAIGRELGLSDEDLHARLRQTLSAKDRHES